VTSANLLPQKNVSRLSPSKAKTRFITEAGLKIKPNLNWNNHGHRPD